MSQLKAVHKVDDIESTKENLEEVSNILDIIFTIIILLNMFLGFFSLISSTGTNLMEQSKEIGVLRGIGYTKKDIKRIYIFETFVLVLSSSILGILAGTFIGSTMTLQQSEFLLLPTNFYFPFWHLFATSVISLICAFIAVHNPIEYMLSKDISEIFRIY